MPRLQQHQQARAQVFSRFNLAVLTAFSIIIIVALTIASFRYFSELDKFKQQSVDKLAAQAGRLNSQLTEIVHTIKGLQAYAQYQLNAQHSLLAQPPLAQDGALFYLDLPPRDVINQRKQLSVNITGLGNIEQFSPELQHELAMAFSLTPGFVNAQFNHPMATWFYYVSVNRFVSLYPWLNRETWHYSNRMAAQEYMDKVKQASSKGELYWTPAFEDSAGKGMMASLTAGVYRHNTFTGALVIDINLQQLQAALAKLLTDDSGMLLLDSRYQVLVDHRLNAKPVNETTQLADILPQSVAGGFIQTLNKHSNIIRLDDWLISKQKLAINGWWLVQYQHYDQFLQPLMQDFTFLFSLLFTGLVLFLVFIYWLTRRTFIKPASEFIEHIENCAQGDPGKIKPTPDWRYWFTIVEDIFTQNRSLLQQLKDQNSLLDKRVNDKTQELQTLLIEHQKNYALLRSVMDAMPEQIIFTDLKGNLIGCNKALEQQVHQSELQLIGKSLVEILAENVALPLEDLIQKALQNQSGKAFQQIIRIEQQSFELFSAQFFDEQNNAVGTINVIRDITRQDQIQSALEQARDAAESANKAKSQFLANMSHEIRTPINAIQGMMYLLQKTPLSKVQAQYLNNAEAASKSLMYLIDELLDLSRIEAGKIPISKQQVELDSIIDKALRLNIGNARKKSLNLTIDIAADVPVVVNTDEVRLLQVITNLLNNAIKFTEQGEVQLQVSCTARDENNALVKFVVIDSGIGIEKSKQHRLFEAFTQADESMTRKYGGSGLGLSICKQIVNLLGGEISLKSEIGKGSEFSFVLPFTHLENQNQQTMQDVSLYSYQLELPNAMQTVIKQKGWHCEIIEQLEQANCKKPDTTSVILICAEHAEQLLNESDSQQRIVTQFDYIAICQPMMAEISEALIQYLSTQSCHWFTLDLPLFRYALTNIEAVLTENQEEDQQSENVEFKAEQNLAGIKVLLVEDNLVNQLVAQELLSSMEADVVTAENGEVALACLAQQAFDIVLMDIQMPVMDGLTACRKIRENPAWQSLPIVAMTAHARVEDQQQSLAAGMNKHIAKPISYEALLETILSLVAKN